MSTNSNIGKDDEDIDAFLLKIKAKKQESFLKTNSKELKCPQQPFFRTTHQKRKEIATYNQSRSKSSEKLYNKSRRSRSRSFSNSSNDDVVIKSNETSGSKKSITEEELPQMPEGTNIRIYSWNVNGIRLILRRDGLFELITQEDPDIFCLSETKIDQELLTSIKCDKIYSDRYMSYWESGSKRGYSGVAVFTKYKPIQIIRGMNPNDKSDGGRVLTLEFPNFLLVAVYSPNSGMTLSRLKYRVEVWDKEFIKFIDSLKKKFAKNIIICGDLNVAHTNLDNKFPKQSLGQCCCTPEERKNFSDFLNMGYIDTFRFLYPKERKYTHISSNRMCDSRLDYFIINKEALPKLVNSEIVHYIHSSNHLPIKLTFKN